MFATHLVEVGVHAAVVLHVLHYVGPLALVRGDNSYLVRLHSTLHQPEEGLANQKPVFLSTDILQPIRAQLIINIANQCSWENMINLNIFTW